MTKCWNTYSTEDINFVAQLRNICLNECNRYPFDIYSSRHTHYWTHLSISFGPCLFNRSHQFSPHLLPVFQVPNNIDLGKRAAGAKNPEGSNISEIVLSIHVFDWISWFLLISNADELFDILKEFPGFVPLEVRLVGDLVQGP